MSYSIGHIYKIICKLDNEFIYIGSTFNQLRHRFQKHKDKYKLYCKDNKKTCSIYPYFEKYGIKNFKIILIKSYNVVRTHQKDHRHLSAYETLWINKSKNCVNQRLPFSPMVHENRIMCIKKYNKTEKVKKYMKNYNKTYYSKNKEKHIDNNKKLKEKYTCICGCIIALGYKSKHEKTKKHLKYCEKI